MCGYFLQNSDNEYLKTLDGANGVLEFTTDVKEAKNYRGLPGGGQWDAENEKMFLDYHFSKQYGEKVTTLACVYKEFD